MRDERTGTREVVLSTGLEHTGMRDEHTPTREARFSRRYDDTGMGAEHTGTGAAGTAMGDVDIWGRAVAGWRRLIGLWDAHVSLRRGQGRSRGELERVNPRCPCERKPREGDDSVYGG